MPIKNYTSKVPANRSIEEIQTALVKNGALGVQYDYEKGTGRIAALRFRLPVKEKLVVFSLPVHWQSFQQVLKNQNIKRHDDEDYVYRVAWRCIRDWVLAQMALYETSIVELPQVFLPFATDNKGQTFYNKIQNNNFLLGDGS